MRVPRNVDRAKVITACATLARTSWHVDDEEMAEVMRQHCCVARDAVDRMQARIRELEAENARLREVVQKLLPHAYDIAWRDKLEGHDEDAQSCANDIKLARAALGEES